MSRVAMTGALLATTAGYWALPGSARAQSTASAQRSMSVPAQPLSDAIILFGRQSGLQVTAGPGLLTGKMSAAISGRMAPAEALSRMLAGTGLTFRFIGGNAVEIMPSPTVADGAVQLGPVRVAGEGGSDGSALLAPAITRDVASTEGTKSYTSPVASTVLRMPLSIRETPQSVTIITQERIKDQNFTDITQALGQTVGISLQEGGSPDADQTDLYARGFAINNWQVDGIARPTAYGFDDGYADMAIYDRVELVRGASGLLNGSGNPGATVNLVRKRPTNDMQIALEAQAGSWNHARGQIDIGGPIDESGRVRARFVTAYQDGGLNIDRATTSRNILYGTVEADVTDTTLMRVGVDYLKRRADDSNMAGVPVMTTDGALTHFSRSKNTVTDWTQYKRDSLSAFASVEQKVGTWTLRGDLDWTRKNYDMVFGYALRGALNTDGTGVGIWPGRWDGDQKMTTVNFTASGPLKIFSDDDLLMVGASHYSTSEQGGIYQLWSFPDYDPSITNYYNWQGNYPPRPADWPYYGQYGYDEAQTAAYGALRVKPLSMLSVMLGGRISNWRRDSWNAYTDGTGDWSRTEDKGVFTPYAGIIVDVLKDVSLYASYTSIFQAQTNRDIDGNFLDPLTGKNYEVGAKASLKGGRLNLSAAWFRIEQSNFPLLVPDVLGPTGDSVYVGVDGTSSEGFEAEVTGELLPGWQVSGGFSHAKVKDRTGKPLNTQVPRDSVRLLSSYDLTRVGVSGLTLGGNLAWNGRTYAAITQVPGVSTVEQGSYAVVDGFIRYEFTSHLSLAVNGTNLFDKYYYSKIAYYGTFGQARRVVATLRAKF